MEAIKFPVFQPMNMQLSVSQTTTSGSIINPARYPSQLSESEKNIVETQLVENVRYLRERFLEGNSIITLLVLAAGSLRNIGNLIAPTSAGMRTGSSTIECDEAYFLVFEKFSIQDKRIRWLTDGSLVGDCVQSGTFLGKLGGNEEIDLSSFSLILEKGEVREVVIQLGTPAHFEKILHHCGHLLGEIQRGKTDLIPVLYWWMVQGSFFESGNAEIFELVISACTDEGRLRPWDPELDSYEAALIYSLDEFVACYELFLRLET